MELAGEGFLAVEVGVAVSVVVGFIGFGAIIRKLQEVYFYILMTHYPNLYNQNYSTKSEQLPCLTIAFNRPATRKKHMLRQPTENL